MSTKAYCNVLARENGLDPAGYAGVFDSAFALELPLPWPHTILYAPERLPPELAKLIEMVLSMPEEEQPRIRPLFIAPDDAYSKVDYRRLIYYTRPAGPFARFERVEYLVPENEVGALMWAFYHQSPELADYDTYIVPSADVRDIMVCTHGSHDVACAKFGYPLYSHLRERFDGSDVRVWRVNHFGGHVFAPTLIDFPKGDYWAYIDPEDGERLVAQEGDISALRGKYRGWAGMPYGFAQAMEREILMREGWVWQTYHKRGIELTKDESDDPKWAEVRIEYASPEGTILGSYEGRVTVGSKVETIASSNEPKTYGYPQYTVTRLEKTR
jgi:hypothetical protein